MEEKALITRAAKAACVEDYNDESETAVPETKQTANITAKRSKPDVAKIHPVRDEFSDSGRSSQTLATLGSTNTSLESKSGSLTIRAESYTVAGKTRPTKIDEKPRSKSRSPEKLPSKGFASKPRKEEKEKAPCSCSECVAKAARPTPHNPSRPTGKSRAPVPGTSQQTRRPPMQVIKESFLPQYAPPRPRVTTSRSYHQERPQSLYAAAPPEPHYIQPIYNEFQPTYAYTPPASIITTAYPPNATPYGPPPHSLHQPQPAQLYPTSPSTYEFQLRPRPRPWPSDYHGPPRPQSVYEPIIEYLPESTYAPTATSVQPPSRRSSHRERPRVLPEQRITHNEDVYNMPPPAPLPPAGHKSTSHRDRRPAIRHAVTADGPPTYNHLSSVRDESITAHVGHESQIKRTHSTKERARRPSHSKGDELAANTYGIERGMARTNVGNNVAKQRRRASVYGHESLKELANEVEAYQASHGNGRPSNHIAIPPPPILRKKTHSSSKSSETSSRKSAKSGKSRASKASRDGSDLKSKRPSETEKFSMRVDASHGINVDLKGGMQGRRISVRQHKDEGEMEFSIGARGRTATGAPRESREKSRKRSSYSDGHKETEIARTRTTSRVRTKIEEEEGDVNETEPRIIRERITTRTRSRRGSSRVGGERVVFI